METGTANNESSLSRHLNPFVTFTFENGIEIRLLSLEYFDFLIYQDLPTILLFNRNEMDSLPSSVIDFKKKIQDADGILICTPDYAVGVPGSLNNAID